MRQIRLIHVGVAVALAAATVTSIGLMQWAGAAGSGTVSSFVPIVPCRLADTRAGAQEGSRHTPLAAQETVTFAVWGTNGNCTIPNIATGIATNVTAVGATADSFLTVFPADVSPRPTASNLNVTSTSPPTPNQVTVSLSATGAIAVYNYGGNVNVIIDIVGYYIPATSGGTPGPQGPQGLQGLPGTNGAPGPACPALGCAAFYTGNNAYKYNSTSFFMDQYGCVILDTDGVAYLVLNLPSGAMLDSVRIRYFDSGVGSTNRTQFTLQSSNEIGSAPTTFSSLSSTADSFGIAAVDLQLTPGRPAQARDSQYRIYIKVYGSYQGFCGAEVGYHF